MIDLSGLSHILAMNLDWLPEQGSSVAAEVDWVFWFIMWLSVFFFVLIVALMLLFALRYRRTNPHDPFPTNVSSHNTTLELVWSIIPSILILFIFWWGFKAWIDMYTPPANGEQIGVRAWKWGWEFTYENGATSSELYVPFDKPVVMTLRSDDVLHSMYIPAFRMKQDVVPGRYTRMWFRPTKFTDAETGPFRFYCAEYCGNGHSIMNGHVHVLAPDAYAEKLKMLASDVTRVLVGGQQGGLDVLEVQAGKTGQGGSGAGAGVHTAAVTAATISADTQWALTGDATGKVGLWSLSGLKGKTANDPPVSMGHADPVQVGSAGISAIAIADDTSYGFVGNTEGAIASLYIGLGNAPSASLVNATAGNHGGAITSLDIVQRAGTSWLLSTGADGVIRLWKVGNLVGAAGAGADSPVKAPALEQVAEAKAGSAFTAAATLKGDYVLGATSSSAALWRVSWPADGTPTIAKLDGIALTGHTGAIRSARLLLSNAGAMYGVTGSADQSFRVWQIATDENGVPTGATNSSTNQVPGPVRQVATTVDGRYILVVLDNGGSNTDLLPYELDFATGQTSAFETIVATRPVSVIATGRGKSPIDSGYEIYLAKCATCHSMDNKPMACPPFNGMWGAQRFVTRPDGTSGQVTVDAEYVHRAIRQPDAEISDGGQGIRWPGVMTNFSELSERDIDDLIAWFKTGPVVPGAAGAAGDGQ